MKKGLIVYHSKTGITKAFGRYINIFLKENNIESKAISIDEYKDGEAQSADVILLGCWTSGLMVVLQHPEQAWIDFAKKLPDLSGKKIGLFTTYKIATGSMFRKMKKHVRCNPGDITLELKSRDGRLSDAHQSALRKFLK